MKNHYIARCDDFVEFHEKFFKISRIKETLCFWIKLMMRELSSTFGHFHRLNFFQGWTYAVDFPAEYHPKKGFTSCVRRRKWIRYRKYVALDTWSAVPGIGKDATEVSLKI